MFTGIVTEVGKILEAKASSEGAVFRISSSKLAPQMDLGHSVSVNGTCLTVVSKGDSWFEVEATPETLRRTNLGELAPGGEVNLELSARLGDFLGGHLVQGHVDGVGRIASITDEGNSWIFRIEAPDEVLRYCTMKGSVTVNGVSLTISGLGSSYFEVAIIPHTYQVTTFSQLQLSAPVNLEADLISKYVESHLRRLGRVAGCFLLLAMTTVWAGAGQFELHPNSILIYSNSNTKRSSKLVVRIARPAPDLVFEWESVNDQGTVHVYQKALQESRKFTLQQLFEVGVDEESPDQTTLQLSRALYRDLMQQKSLKLRLNGTPLKMKLVGEEPYTLKLDQEMVEVTAVRVTDDRRGSWLFLKDPELPLVLAHDTPYFQHRLESLSTPERPSLRWFRRIPPIK